MYSNSLEKMTCVVRGTYTCTTSTMTYYSLGFYRLTSHCPTDFRSCAESLHRKKFQLLKPTALGVLVGRFCNSRQSQAFALLSVFMLS